MKEDIVSVTDHIKDFSIEKEILGNYFQEEFSFNTTIALVWHKEINKKFLEKYPNLRALVRYGVGYDNIDIDLCREKKIIVINTPDYGVDEVSDTALGMILNLTRNINGFQILAKSDPNYWIGKKITLEAKRINTLSLGVIGLGRIGGSLLRKYQSLSNNTFFYDPYQPSGIEKIFQTNRCGNLSDLLENSDIVSINTPLNNETKGMVNEGFIEKMKEKSYLINVSRGPIVEDQEIIFKNIKSGKLSGYATDVWTEEPPSKEDENFTEWINDSELSSKVIINPHTAYYSDDSLYESRLKACKSCLNIINGQQIMNRII